MSYTSHEYDLAREVIREACANSDGSQVADFDAVIARRWPGGSGGVGHSHRKTARAIREAIRDFYQPPDWSPEPTGMRE
jgi:hypothetical protein